VTGNHLWWLSVLEVLKKKPGTVWIYVSSIILSYRDAPNIPNTGVKLAEYR
jgi:hypothetical protein